jgi:hypothetical protein
MSFITKTLIHDFMTLPLAPYQSLYKKVHTKRLTPIIPSLTNEFYRIFQKISIREMSNFKQYADVETTLTAFRNNSFQDGKESYFLSFFTQIHRSSEKSSLDSIIALLEDNCVILDIKSTKLWISYCIHTLLDFQTSRTENTSPGLSPKGMI